MKKSLFIISAFLLFANIGNIKAQEEVASKHQVGFHAGNTTGIGFSYRYWPGKCGLQVTTTPPWLEDGKLSYFNGGVSFLYSLVEVSRAKMFMYGSASYVSKRSFESQWIQTGTDPYGYSSGYYVEGYKYNEKLNAGIGLGFDIYAGKQLGFNIQTGYGLFDFQKGVNTSIAVEAGIYFKFFRGIITH